MYVLVLDDDRSMQKTLQMSLMIIGCDVLLASTVNEAIELYAAHPQIQMMTVDGHLSDDDFDTEPFIRWVRDSGFTGILVCVSGNKNIEDQALQAGANHFWLKGKEGMVDFFDELVNTPRGGDQDHS